MGAEKDGRLNAYVHLVSWEEAAFLEAKDLLSRAFQGRLSLMIRTFAKKSSLSREELDELYAILKQLDVDEDA